MLNIKFIQSNFIEKFEATVSKLGYEQKGIWFSEMLFIYMFYQQFKPEVFIETGRARGQSTVCLSRLLPSTEIISIEHDKESEDAIIAEKRLSKCKNVQMIYGDAFKESRNLANKNNFLALIDGPKNEAAVKLAQQFLKDELCVGVFMHDCAKGKISRAFEEIHNGISFFSDDEGFCSAFSYLDKECYNKKRQPYSNNGIRQQSYGPTVGLFLKEGTSAGKLSI